MGSEGEALAEGRVTLHHGNCLDVLPALPDASIDAVITDPPYPCIDRSYGRWTEEEWWDLMMDVVKETRRVLKPKGSAVFVLQPNSRKLGSMRGWLWEFMAWVCREWNQVQDVWWWNTSCMPEAHAIQGQLTRPGLKACVWCGPPDCWRDQDAVLMEEAEDNARDRSTRRVVGRLSYISRHFKSSSISESAVKRGGVTPMNVLPIGSDARWSGGTHGHGASTPLALMSWWTRYVCPPGGVVLDPFAGSGTAALAALKEGRRAVLVERVPEYCGIIRRRLAEPGDGPLFEAPKEAPSRDLFSEESPLGQ